MNAALWRKAAREAWPVLAAVSLLLFAFDWLFVWLSGQFDLAAMLELVPPMFRRLPGLPLEELASPAGRIAVGYVDPVIVLAAAAWAVSRGSDAISGEIGRGTMELLLAQPVRRVAVLASQAGVAICGSAALAAAAWLGTWLGIATFRPDGVAAIQFVPAAVNLFFLSAFMAGLTTLLSSWDSYRWRTIGLMGSVIVVSIVLQVVVRMAPRLEWMRFLTFFAAYEPQTLVTDAERAWELSLTFNGILGGLAALSYTVAGVIFTRRDLPAPL